MNHTIIPPHEPKPFEPVRPPMVYVKQSAKWEYKQITRNLKKENPPNEAELNALGEQGWEMTGLLEQKPFVHFYFKREVEK